jgi:hypothetical protein
MILTEVLHGAAFDINASLLVEVDGQFFIRPVGSVKTATWGALFHPLLDRWGQFFGNPPRLAGSPLNLEAAQAPLVIAF